MTFFSSNRYFLKVTIDFTVFYGFFAYYLFFWQNVHLKLSNGWHNGKECCCFLQIYCLWAPFNRFQVKFKRFYLKVKEDPSQFILSKHIPLAIVYCTNAFTFHGTLSVRNKLKCFELKHSTVLPSQDSFQVISHEIDLLSSIFSELENISSKLWRENCRILHSCWFSTAEIMIWHKLICAFDF